MGGFIENTVDAIGSVFSGPKKPIAPAPVPITPLPKTPEVQQVKTPTVNQEQVDRQTSDLLRRRKGARATVGTGETGTTTGSVAVKSLLGQ